VKIKATIVKSPLGLTLSINGYRVAGPKPYGGEVLAEWDIAKVEILTALDWKSTKKEKGTEK
jgi:hypothetical protein